MRNSVKPKLLILTSSFPSGPGDETCGYIRDHARSLAKDFEVCILAPADARARRWPGDLFTVTRSASFLPRGLDPFQATRDFNRLASGGLFVKLGVALSLVFYFARAFNLALRADVICSHWLVPCGLIGSAISRLLGKPHIAVEHSGALHLLSRMKGGRRLARFALGGSDCVVTVSADLKQKLVALCPDAENKVAVISMGIDAARQSACRTSVRSEPGERIVLFIGRLTKIKGLDVLLRAMKLVTGARLLVAGDGEHRRELEKLAAELSVDAKFLGRIGSLERDDLLSASAAVVIPSLEMPDGRTEGLPVVCLEAMAASRPVIASRVGGLAEIIGDNRNGLLFNPGDHAGLAAQLELVFNDAAFTKLLGANARQTAAAHDWTKVGARYAELINDALRKRPKPGHEDSEAAPRFETESRYL